MNLDALISKYLDSELTPLEDEKLRELLSADKFARDVFDSSVELNYELKQDAANILPPEDLVRRTEDLVLMKILQNTPQIAAQKANPKRRRRFVPAFSALLAVMFIANVLQISDSFRLGNLISFNNSNEPTALDNKTLTQDVAENNINLTNEKKEIAANADTKSAVNNLNHLQENIKNSPKDFEIAMQAATAEGEQLMLNDSKFELEPANIQNTSSDYKANYNDSKQVASASIQSHNANLSASLHPQIRMQGVSQSMPGSVIWEFIDINEVQASTFLGTTLFSGGLKEKKVSVNHFAQSIGYAITPSFRAGLEVGLTELTFDEMVKTNILIGSPKPESMIEIADIPGNGERIVIYANMEKRKELWWFAPFVEYSFLTNSAYSISGRSGIGLSSDGMLGYGRLFGKYQVIGGVYVTFGIEGRLFQSVYSGTQRAMNSNVSLIYGLQFRFY